MRFHGPGILEADIPPLHIVHTAPSLRFSPGLHRDNNLLHFRSQCFKHVPPPTSKHAAIHEHVSITRHTQTLRHICNQEMIICLRDGRTNAEADDDARRRRVARAKRSASGKHLERNLSHPLILSEVLVNQKLIKCGRPLLESKNATPHLENFLCES